MSQQLRSYIGLAVLFVVSFFAIHWVYGYVLVIQGQSNDGFFMFGRQFLLEFLDRPAGPLRYAGRFLSQFYHYPWLGALIVSTGIACFGLLFHRVLIRLNGTAQVSQALLPCVLLLALHTSTVCLIHDKLGVLASCGAFLGYLSFRGKVARRLYALVTTPVVCLFLGVYAWFFVAWIAMGVASRRGKRDMFCTFWPTRRRIPSTRKVRTCTCWNWPPNSTSGLML